MTQPQNPWEQAAQQYAPQQQAQQPVQQYQPPAPQSGGSSALAGAYAPEPPQSRLFNQGGGAPMLFNKTHFVGTERWGIITAAPETKQDQNFKTREPKYWSKSKVGVPTPAITTDAIDGPTGERNEPVLVEHFALQTEYRMDESECYAVERPVSFAREDDGKRVEIIGGRDLKAFRKAMKDFTDAGGKLASPDDFIGLKLAAKRAGQVPAGANKAWVREFILSRP